MFTLSGSAKSSIDRQVLGGCHRYFWPRFDAQRSVMHLAREGAPDINVEDVVHTARAAGRVVMDVYKTDPKVETWNNVNTLLPLMIAGSDMRVPCLRPPVCSWMIVSVCIIARHSSMYNFYKFCCFELKL